jgi:hypothetical protein
MGASLVEDRVVVSVRRDAAAEEDGAPLPSGELVARARRDEDGVPRPDLSLLPVDLHAAASLEQVVELLEGLYRSDHYLSIVRGGDARALDA